MSFPIVAGITDLLGYQLTLDQTADIEWRDGHTPVSTRFDDPYFSVVNGLQETAHVYLTGNGLPGRFRPGFQIAELGFGTGLNLFAALQSWALSGQQGKLHFTSFEAFPMAEQDMRQSLAAFPEILPFAEPFLAELTNGKRQFDLQDAFVDIVLGDARTTLPRWQGKADAWFLDGFSPAKNPELWEPALMQSVADHTKPDGTFATYTAAGHVRKSLTDAGFAVQRISGFGRKRHMTIGKLAGRR